MADSKLIHIRVPRKLARRLARLADSTDRSVSDLAGKAIAKFVDLHEGQVRAILQGRAEADAGRLVPHNVAKCRLEKWKGSS